MMKFPIVDPTTFFPKSPAMDVMALSPLVMAMRMPQMVFEQAWPFFGTRKDEGEKAVVEKAAASFESYGAVQAEMTHSLISMWFGAVGGKVPDPTDMARSWHDIMDASLQPSAKRVRKNYDRLVAERG